VFDSSKPSIGSGLCLNEFFIATIFTLSLCYVLLDFSIHKATIPVHGNEVKSVDSSAP